MIRFRGNVTVEAAAGKDNAVGRCTHSYWKKSGFVETPSESCRQGNPRVFGGVRDLHFALLRYSGMRISDAVALSADRLQGSKLFLYTQKTGVPVYTVLPDFLVKTLEATPPRH